MLMMMVIISFCLLLFFCFMAGLLSLLSWDARLWPIPVQGLAIVRGTSFNPYWDPIGDSSVYPISQKRTMRRREVNANWITKVGDMVYKPPIPLYPSCSDHITQPLGPAGSSPSHFHPPPPQPIISLDHLPAQPRGLSSAILGKLGRREIGSPAQCVI